MRQSEWRPGQRQAWLRAFAALSLSAAVFCAAHSAGAQTPSKPEAERQRLLDQLGLERRKAPAPDSPAEAEKKKEKKGEDEASGAPAAPGAPRAAAPDAAGDKAAGDRVAPPPALGFGGRVHSALLAACASCHGSGRIAARAYVLDGNPDADHAATLRYVTAGQPESSALLRLSAGGGHAGGAVLPPSRAEHQLLARWIADGAKRGGEASAPPLPPASPAASGVAPSTPPPPVVSREAAAGAESAAPAPALMPAPASGASVGSEPAVVYAPVIHEQLTQSCAACHRTGAAAGSSGYLLTGDVGADFASARRFVDLEHPEQSALLRKVSGAPHAGGAPYPPGSEPYLRLLAWIQFGALGPSGAIAGAVPAPASSDAPAVPSAAPSAAAAGTLAGHGSPEHHQGLSLPLQLRLNGRFDLSYERRNFDANPFADGDDALQSYHHFLFLSRHTREDRIGFTLELVNLTFWEVSYSVPLAAHVGQLWVKAGKLLVPFGVDPLFHQNYGGLSGFDQRFLPVIWAREGLAARLVREQGALSWSADLYAVAGHELRADDSVLNLQGDLSPLDSTHIAFGARLRGAYGPLSLYYSGYVNGLGFGRVLYLQALDLALWRLRGVPALQHFAADLGLSRADVSGAGAGEDYYHFASYFRVRYFPLEALYFQYRQGLRTFNNRRGVVFDATRATAEDGSTHNFGAVVRGGPLTFGVYYFLNLEKVDEVHDDFLRVTGTYEF